MVDRVGAALLAPDRALAAAEASPVAGRPATDLAIVILLGFLAVEARQVVAIVWLGAVGGVGLALGNLLALLSRAVAADFTFLLVAAVGLTLAVGRRRSLARDFDLACVAVIPLVAVEIATSLAIWAAPGAVRGPLAAGAGVVAYGWAALVLALAWRRARRRPAAAGEELAGSGGAARARWAGVGLAAVVVALLAIDVAWIARHYRALRPMTAGDPAPDFALPEVDREGRATGRTLALSAQRGRVVVVDFWASWCGPCRQAMPRLEQLYRARRGQGLVLLSIKTDGPEMGRAGPAVAHTSFPLVVDDGAIGARYKVSNLPHVVVVDRRGVVRFVHRGEVDAGRLDREVERLLAEPMETRSEPLP